MRKSTLNFSQGMACVALFLLGNALVTGGDRTAGRDSWLLILGLILPALLLGMMYMRILNLHPGQSIFSILRHVFGKVAGKGLSLFLALYLLHLYALVLLDFAMYASVVSLPNTSIFLIAVPLILLTVSLAGKNIQVIGRVSLLLFLSVMIYFLVNVLISFPYFRYENILPILHRPIEETANGALGLLASPFAELLAFLPILSFVRKGTSRSKVLSAGILTGGLIFAYTAIRNLLMLGEDIYTGNYYPSVQAVSLIIVGNYLQHSEMVVTFVMLFSVFIKSAVCLFGARQGLDAVFPKQKPKWVLYALAGAWAVAALFLFQSPQQIRWFSSNIYPYYALPIQIVLPLVFWIGAEVKSRKEKRGAVAG